MVPLNHRPSRTGDLTQRKCLRTNKKKNPSPVHPSVGVVAVGGWVLLKRKNLRESTEKKKITKPNKPGPEIG